MQGQEARPLAEPLSELLSALGAEPTDTSVGGGGPAGDALLLETGDFVLLETGDYLLLE